MGKWNTASVSLHKLEADRFSLSRLVAKLANISSDLPSERLVATSVFKAITGRDTVNAEHKFKDSFDFDPFVRLFFSANHPPSSRDTSEGFYDRWVVVPFTRTFRGTDEEIPREELDARLSSPDELSGLLNRALDALNRFKANGQRYSISDSANAALFEFRALTDSLARWLDFNTIDSPKAMAVKAELLKAYNTEAASLGQVPATAEGFALALKKLRPNISASRRMVNGKLEHVWLGIELRT